MSETVNKNCVIAIDSYLVNYAQQKVRKQNGGQIVKPVPKDVQQQSETSSNQVKESSS